MKGCEEEQICDTYEDKNRKCGHSCSQKEKTFIKKVCHSMMGPMGADDRRPPAAVPEAKQHKHKAPWQHHMKKEELLQKKHKAGKRAGKGGMFSPYDPSAEPCPYGPGSCGTTGMPGTTGAPFDPYAPSGYDSTTGMPGTTGEPFNPYAPSAYDPTGMPGTTGAPFNPYAPSAYDPTGMPGTTGAPFDPYAPSMYDPTGMPGAMWRPHLKPAMAAVLLQKKEEPPVPACLKGCDGPICEALKDPTKKCGSTCSDEVKKMVEKVCRRRSTEDGPELPDCLKGCDGDVCELMQNPTQQCGGTCSPKVQKMVEQKCQGPKVPDCMKGCEEEQICDTYEDKNRKCGHSCSQKEAEFIKKVCHSMMGPM